MKQQFFAVLTIILLHFPLLVPAQMITGVWHGKINKQRAEVKIILNGDSLTGTSYYYESANVFRRYSIKGYFDQDNNSAVWWDDQLLEEKTGRINISSPGKNPLLATADFNCPGGGKMMLDGTVVKKEKDTKGKGDLHLVKDMDPLFADEWDFVIDNYTVGTNDPDIIDSISGIAKRKTAEPVIEIPEITSTAVVEPSIIPAIKNPEHPASNPDPVLTKAPAPPVSQPVVAVSTPTIEEKYMSRKKEMIKEIPLSGDSIELRFYDNAEIDGDSISLFLNDQLIFSHIRLTGSAYTIKLAVRDMKDDNELTMVAENLGTIPPNTSYMVAVVDNKRYDAYLASTEGSSAMVRFLKTPVQ